MEGKNNQTYVGFNTNTPKQNNPKSNTFLGKVLYIIGTSAGLVVVLLVIGGGATLAGRVWDPEWNPFRPNPDKVISQAFLKMQDLKTFHIDSELDFSTAPQYQKNPLFFTSDINVIDAANPNISIGFNKDSYSNMNNVNNSSPESFLFKFFATNINKIKGSWIKFPQNNQLQNVVYLENIENVLLKNNIYVFKKKLPDEIVSGQKIYHYFIALDNSKLQNVIGGNVGPDFLNKIGQVNIDLAIGSKDNYVHSFKIEKQIDISNIDQNMKGVVDSNINVNFSKFNQ